MKRSSTAPAPDPENPHSAVYLAARREWNERYGSYIAQANAWRLTALASLGVAFVAVGGRGVDRGTKPDRALRGADGPARRRHRHQPGGHLPARRPQADPCPARPMGGQRALGLHGRGGRKTRDHRSLRDDRPRRGGRVSAQRLVLEQRPIQTGTGRDRRGRGGVRAAALRRHLAGRVA